MREITLYPGESATIGKVIVKCEGSPTVCAGPIQHWPLSSDSPRFICGSRGPMASVDSPLLAEVKLLRLDVAAILSRQQRTELDGVLAETEGNSP